MADSITSSKTLSIGLEYIETDGTKKTATVKIPNQQSNLTESQIKNAFSNSVLIYGYNEQGAPMTLGSDNVYTASTTDETINNLDIGWDE